MLRMGPSVAALAEVDADTREQVAQRLRTLLKEREKSGRVTLSGRCWLVQAVRPSA